MYPPITCLCGRPIGHVYRAFQLMCMHHRARNPTRDNVPIGYILDQLKITRECCRARIMTCTEFKNYYNRYDPANTAPTMSMDQIEKIAQR